MEIDYRQVFEADVAQEVACLLVAEAFHVFRNPIPEFVFILAIFDDAF